MNKRLFIFILPTAILLLGISVLFAKTFFTPPQKTHYHAGFVVFQNGKRLNFSDDKYMFIEPCSTNEKETNPPQDIQVEKAHLHDNVGDVVHIERTGAHWNDLFTNIHFPLNYSKTTGYINGKQVNNYLAQSIKLDDSLVVFIGKSDTKLLAQAVTRDYIQKIAKKSTTCGD